MKNIVLVLLLGISSIQAKSYEGSIKVNKWNYDEGYGIPKGISFAPSQPIDQNKTPFKKEEKRHKIAVRRLHDSIKKMQERFKRTGTHVKETAQHARLREAEKKAKKQIVWRYNLICGSSVPKLMKLQHQIRGYEKKLRALNDSEKANMQDKLNQARTSYQEILQPLIDNAFVYREFPYDDTWDNTLYPSDHRTLYDKISKQVWRAMKKGKGTLVKNEVTDNEKYNEADVETSGEYNKQFDEITQDFLAENFEIQPSSRFNPRNNPFKRLHQRRVIELEKLERIRKKMALSEINKSGFKRESHEHEQAREAVKQVEIEISKLFHRLLKRDYALFERNVDQMRRCLRIIEMKEDGSKNKGEDQYQRYQKNASLILQKMIDKAFAHEPFPSDQDYDIDTKYRGFYKAMSKLVL